MTEELWLIISAAILGVVEGVTEFLPISSTGHLILVNQVIELQEPFANLFNVVIQFGAILAVVMHFRRRLWPFVSDPAQRAERMSLWMKTLAGLVPALVIGALAADAIEERLFRPMVVAVALVIGGIVLLVIDRRVPRNAIDSISGVTYRMAVLTGLIQCLAMVPGTSRSAATIIGGMLLGMSRVVAAEFSFFLAIPTMAAASGYTLLKGGAHMDATQWVALAVGFVVSFFVAWAVIAMFMRYIQRNNFIPFAWYRIVLGAVVLGWFWWLG